MKESNDEMIAKEQELHLHYIELQAKYDQQQYVIEQQKQRTEQLLEELLNVKQQLKQATKQIAVLTEDNLRMKEKYKFQLQHSAEKQLQLEASITTLKVKEKLVMAPEVESLSEEPTKERYNVILEKKDEKISSAERLKQIQTPSITVQHTKVVQPKKSLVPKPTVSKHSIKQTIKQILMQDTQVLANHNFRSDEDEYQFAEAIIEHLLHKQHEPKMLVGQMVTTYEKDYEEKTYNTLRVNPYFARMDFKVGNNNKAYYIGKFPIDQYVIPWQSRLAKSFYTLSMEQEFEINRELKGKLDYRRNIDFQDGKIKYLHEPETPENALNRAVVHRIEQKRGKEMEVIVETIQKQQYDMIALPISEPIIIQGSAGSGKSAIALHRLSYILANHKTLSEKHLAIFTPNEAFLHHIQTVLPELGHEEIQQFTLQQFVTRRTGAKWSKQQGDELLGVKATVAYGQQLEHEINERLNQQLPFAEAIATELDQIMITMTSQTLQPIIAKLEKYPQHKKRAIGKKMLEKALDVAIEQKSVEQLCTFSTEKLTANNRLYLVKHAKQQLLEAFTKQYRRYEHQLVLAVAKELLQWTGPFERAHIAPILHTYMIVNGKRPIFEYVIVDEAQDYTPYEIWLLNQLCKDQNIMLIGDIGQAIQPYYQPDSWQAYDQAIGKHMVHSLTHTYRSTMQIVEQANKIITPISKGKFEVATFNPRLGSDVREESIPLELIDARVAYWVEQYMAIGYQSFAFVSLDPDVQFDIDIPVVTTANYASVVGAKMVVGTPLELKGLEFDVVFVDQLAPFPSSDYGKKLLYVAYTRALHQLHLFKMA